MEITINVKRSQREINRYFFCLLDTSLLSGDSLGDRTAGTLQFAQGYDPCVQKSTHPTPLDTAVCNRVLEERKNNKSLILLCLTLMLSAFPPRWKATCQVLLLENGGSIFTPVPKKI